jgi:hypothetical protein
MAEDVCFPVAHRQVVPPASYRPQAAAYDRCPGLIAGLEIA